MTRTTSAAVRTQAPSLSNTRTTDPESEFARAVGQLGDASWTFVESQRGKGGQVGPAQQELWRAYELYRQGDRLTDSPALRGMFLEQLSGLKQWAGARGGLGALTADGVARFRAELALGTRNGKPLTAEQKREVSEQLTYKAFERAVWSGLVMGLVVPNRHRKDDFDLLAQDKTSLAGPIFRTNSADNQSRYYASVLVAEPNGKKRVEFLEVSPDSPKVKAALQKQPAKTIPQAEADVPLSASRFEHRFNDAERKQLVAYANMFAQFQVTSKAVKAADPLEAVGDAPPVMKKPETPAVKTPSVSQFVPLRETPEGVTLDGGTVRVGDRDLEYPAVEFKPTDKGAVGRFKEYLAEKGLKEKSLAQTGEGNSRIVLEHEAFPGKVIKVYDPKKLADYNTRTPYLLQRELALESFLSGLGVRVAKIDRDPALLSRGIIVQEKVKGAPYAEVRDTLPPEVRQRADALIDSIKERYNVPLFEDYGKRSGSPIMTREGPGKPLTPAGLDLNIDNVWVDTTKQPPELVIIDW